MILPSGYSTIARDLPRTCYASLVHLWNRLWNRFQNRHQSLVLQQIGTEEAVVSELVSARLFPVTRENTGKFAIFGFEIAKAPQLSEENSIA